MKELRALAEDLRVDIDSRARKSEIAHAVADAQWQERNLKE